MDYYYCDNCDQIEKDGNILECPFCNKNGSYNKTWPKVEVIELIKFIESLKGTTHYKKVACVFVSSVLELLLEELVTTMAYIGLDYHESSIVVDTLLETNQGRSKMLNLYKHLGYGSFAKETLELGYNSFFENWNKIVTARNKIVHGDLENTNEITESLIEDTLNEALDVFSKLQNKYYHDEMNDWKWSKE